jgi:hypothetical protein
VKNGKRDMEELNIKSMNYMILAVKIEGGFRFMKAPQFIASSFFVKKHLITMLYFSL